ncbi:CocE/NonD family hydrolase [Nocardioides sp.]|uniref:CocE/NonD family hydrolase n=1 Tax=Nocardioides sp. TaxID=35761 RepID=UPI0019AC1AC6|nr:CocE/NonD family hydrolase [Nocardioides sp.]MBC7279406.1 CocE/NonD family hydrolase [Nocardioides sp.]
MNLGILSFLFPFLALVTTFLPPTSSDVGSLAGEAESMARTLPAAPAVAPQAPQAAPAAQPQARAGAWKPRPATYGVVVEKDVPITMSDGVVLLADIHRPAKADGTAAAGRFPVILTQNPYNKNLSGGSGGDYFVERGYVYVQTDVRGTGSSAGQWDAFGDREQKDGLEVANWATSKQRPWSNGELGLWGASYMAINQFFTAAQHPRGLKAMFPIVPAGDVYRDVVASGGQIDAGFIPLWFGLVTGTGLVPPAVNKARPEATLTTLLQHVGGALGFQVPMLASAVLGSDAAYDGPFYRKRSPLSVVDEIDVPTFVTAGQYDIFQRGAPMLFDRMQRNGVDTKLLVGPWTHTEAATAAGLEGSGINSLNEMALRWFDTHLMGLSDTSLDRDVAPVTYHEIGSEKWRTMQSWLGSEVRAKSYALGSALKPVGGDTIVPLPVQGLCSRSTAQWTAGALAIPGCETDNRINDALGVSYETSPAASDLAFSGPLNADLSVSTTGTDGLISVSVEDVAPDGSVDRITGGWQTLRHRAVLPSKSRMLNGQVVQPWHPFTREAEQPVTPGKIYRVPVEVFPTGAVIKKGHRLRVTVHSYDVPHLLPNVKQLVRGVAGVVTVHHTKAHPSTLILPVRR